MLCQRRQQWTHAVCLERVWVLTQSTVQHVATVCTGDVWECEEVWQEWQSFVCKVCRGGGRKAADEFHFEDVEFECVGEFAYR